MSYQYNMNPLFNMNNQNMNMINNNMNINNQMNMNNQMNLNNPMYMNNQMNINNMNYGMNINNQLFTQMKMMNMMMNCINNFNDFVNEYNKMAKRNNEETKVDIINEKNAPKVKLPRNGTTSHFGFPQINGNRMNIIFVTPAGYKVIMNTPINMRIRDILVEYGLKVGVGPNIIDTKIYFLFNGRKILKSDFNKTPLDLGINDQTNLIVIDPEFVIGSE